MNVRRTLAAVALFLCFGFFAYLAFDTSHAQTVVTTVSGKFYRLDVLATNGMSGITTINSSSINDSGTAAFNAIGAGLFTDDGRTPLRNIAGPNVGAPQINNNNHIIYRSTNVGASVGTSSCQKLWNCDLGILVINGFQSRFLRWRSSRVDLLTGQLYLL